MRVLSETMNDIRAKAIARRLADDYDKLADRAAERASGLRRRHHPYRPASASAPAGMAGPVPCS
jgi:hypothetical protein